MSVWSACARKTIQLFISANLHNFQTLLIAFVPFCHFLLQFLSFLAFLALLLLIPTWGTSLEEKCRAPSGVWSRAVARPCCWPAWARAPWPPASCWTRTAPWLPRPGRSSTLPGKMDDLDEGPGTEVSETFPFPRSMISGVMTSFWGSERWIPSADGERWLGVVTDAAANAFVTRDALMFHLCYLWLTFS